MVAKKGRLEHNKTGAHFKIKSTPVKFMQGANAGLGSWIFPLVTTSPGDELISKNFSGVYIFSAQEKVHNFLISAS